jgi:hypothetical protein
MAKSRLPGSPEWPDQLTCALTTPLSPTPMVPTRSPFTDTTNAIIQSALLWPNEQGSPAAAAGEALNSEKP